MTVVPMAGPLHGTLAEELREQLARELGSGDATRALPAGVRERIGRLVLDELFELVAVLAPDGTVLEVNEPALALARVERDAVLARPLWQACAPWVDAGTAARLEEAVRRAAGGAFVRDEADAVFEGGPAATFDFSLRPVRHAGVVIAIVAEARDVTSMRRQREVAQRDLAEHADEVGRLVGELGRRKRELETALDAMRFAREQADRASAQKTSLLRMVSHELRTPLAALLLQVDRLRRDAAELSPHHRDAVARMRSALGRLSGLVDSLLEYSRIDAGHVTITPVRLDPVAVAEEVVHELTPLAAAKGLDLRGPAPGSAPPLETDARLLRLVLFNLAQNAIKFTQAGSISISVAAEGGEHRLSVHDTGRGIALEDQARIFEPFEQLETLARKHTPGVGLGLALVKEMIGALGGRIALESTPGAGSTFTVRLPSRRKTPGRGAEPSFTPAPH
jgi:signal transduction histidine kinase